MAVSLGPARHFLWFAFPSLSRRAWPHLQILRAHPQLALLSFVGWKSVLEEDTEGRMLMPQTLTKALEKCTPFETAALWLAIVPKEITRNVHSFGAPRMSTTVLFILARNWKQPLISNNAGLAERNIWDIYIKPLKNHH